MCWRGCERVTLFVNNYGVMAWVLGGEAQTNEQECRQGKCERGYSIEWTILEALEVFKEHLWHRGVETVGEVSEDKREEEEEVFNYIKG